MHIEFLVEDFSTEETLCHLLPNILGDWITFNTHSFQGKQDLLSKLPNRLKGYKAWIPDDYRIIILVDRDNEDCQKLKLKLEKIAKDAGFVTKSLAKSKSKKKYQLINRIMIEELEAWFFGDIPALIQAYPKVSKNLDKKAKYCYPDDIKGGTREALQEVLQRKGYHQGGLEKLKVARDISPYMNPTENTSKSFQVFYRCLLEMMEFE
ncbi:MAG: DUF4276 family protein [Microcoleaceae cyanobacterium MO_207.B10]|nr:DUF4276 family protein [Microcoleaceae cyanobacterium MO_207.B10]